MGPINIYKLRCLKSIKTTLAPILDREKHILRD